MVIHTYGSAWSMNNMKGSADLSTICAAYVKAGYAVVTPNHRSASDAIYPAQLHDIKAVVRQVQVRHEFCGRFRVLFGWSPFEPRGDDLRFERGQVRLGDGRFGR